MTCRRAVWAWIVASLCMAGTVAWTATQDPPGLKPGLWEGAFTRPNGDRPMRLVLTRDGTTWSGSVDFPAATVIGVPLADIDISATSASFTAPSAPGQPTVKGTVAADGMSITGTFKQGTGTFPLKLTWTGEAPLPLTVVDGAKLQGIWEGRLNMGALSLRVIFRVSRTAAGVTTATLESPDQGPGEVAVNGIGFKEPKVRFVVDSIGGSYEGALGADGKTLTGTLSQGALPAMPLVLTRVERVTQVKHPQEPKRPFPYEEVDVTYRNDAAGITIAGTLTRPRGAGPFAAALLITGSGSQDRDETLFGHKPFLLIADYLTRRGVAVLRVDDRGVGGTGGDDSGTSKDFAGDVQAGVRFLAGRKDIDAKHIGLIGHSEGGLIAPMVASQPDSGVAFIVMLAGPGVPGDEILYEQGALIMAASGAAAEDLKISRAQQEQLVAVVRAGGDLRVMQQKLRSAGIPAAADRYLSPWYRFFLTYDPRPALSLVKAPVLALFGARDLQVPPAQNAPALEATLKSGASKDHQVRVLPGLNHLFQASSTGLPTEYGDIEETMSPVALQAIADWVVARAIQKR